MQHAELAGRGKLELAEDQAGTEELVGRRCFSQALFVPALLDLVPSDCLSLDKGSITPAVLAACPPAWGTPLLFLDTHCKRRAQDSSPEHRLALATLCPPTFS